MKRLATLAFFILLTTLASTAFAGGIVLERTRVIYDASKKEAALPLANHSEKMPYLLQSWVENSNNSSRGPFIVTPPLFRLDAGEDSTLRIIKADGQVPNDRESMYFINVRAIPAQNKADLANTNTLTLVFKTRIKIFYRPKGLNGKARDAFKALEFGISANQLTIYNPSAYHVVFAGLSLDNVNLTDKIEYIAPQERKIIAINATTGRTVKWAAINDFGGSTAPETRLIP